ncbi:chaperone modulatory protein CbpM [Mangrovimicrobium sediminis]|uniref:Chaperone modulatory protein CbpM n=1 Tax=Mangrovimicrobium sediminis TaxID=2562682 RepID=A0A4Z0LUM2_9GAMM|nr:chaperone modulator CbpM [Haliea sp. SAOS-164]TGD70980.1 chaperone modulatory protein CbpM [Haliea sp. SAOS-164]
MQAKLSLEELCAGQGLSRSLVVEMVEYEVVRPVAGERDADWLFEAGAAHWAKRALRLKSDLDLDWLAVAMLVDLLREREALARENAQLRQRLARFLAQD